MSSLLAGRPAIAHHGTRGAYNVDVSKELTMTGTVTQFQWGNPHIYLLYDVTDDKGNVVHWTAETHPPYVMFKHGWNKQTLKPGDQITITVFPAKAGGPSGLLSKISLNGKLLLDDEQVRLSTDTKE